METDYLDVPGIDQEFDQENKLPGIEEKMPGIDEETNEYKSSEQLEENEIEEEENEEVEQTSDEMETIDYDRIECIVQTATTPADLDTLLDNLAVTDVLMLILALVLGILIVKARN